MTDERRIYALYMAASAVWRLSSLATSTSEALDRLACRLEGRAEHLEENDLIREWADGIDLEEVSR